MHKVIAIYVMVIEKKNVDIPLNALHIFETSIIHFLLRFSFKHCHLMVIDISSEFCLLKFVQEIRDIKLNFQNK